MQREIMELVKGQISPPKISEYLVNIPRRHYQVHEAQAIGKQILMAEKLAEQAVALDGEEKPEEGEMRLPWWPGTNRPVCQNLRVLTANLLNILSAQIQHLGEWDRRGSVRVQSLIEEGLLQSRRGRSCRRT